jgi:hypothetical protein
LLIDVEISRADVHRVPRYLGLVGKLRTGRIAGETFQRRVTRWEPIDVLGPAEVAGRWRFLADPDAVLALTVVAEEEEIEDWVDSGRSRPLPRRRAPRKAK